VRHGPNWAVVRVRLEIQRHLDDGVQAGERSARIDAQLDELSATTRLNRV